MSKTQLAGSVRTTGGKNNKASSKESSIMKAVLVATASCALVSRLGVPVTATATTPKYTTDPGGVEFQHDGYTRTRVPRQKWNDDSEAPRVLYRFPKAVEQQGMRLSPDKQWIFIPHVDNPDEILHFHFLSTGQLWGEGTKKGTQAGYAYGALTPGNSSLLLDTNVAQFSFQERVVYEDNAPPLKPEFNPVLIANQTWSEPTLRRQSIDPSVRDDQIFATWRFTFASASTMNRYHAMNNPGLVDRLRAHAGSDQAAPAAQMEQKVAYQAPLFTTMGDELDRIDLSQTPSKLLKSSGVCHHFSRHIDFLSDDVEATKLPGGSTTRKGSWIKLDHLFVARRADAMAAPLAGVEYRVGTNLFKYDETHDTLMLLNVFHGILWTQFTPPAYTDSPALPLGQRVEVAPYAHYREFPINGYADHAPDTRVTNNNMWQSEVAKYWYQKMWTYPQDFTYFWPENANAEDLSARRCSEEYLQEEVLEEMEDWNWPSLSKRVRAPDVNVITSEIPTSVSQDRQTVVRLARKASNCFLTSAGPEVKHAIGFSIASGIALFHIMDELASTYKSRRVVHSPMFLQRVKWQQNFATKPFEPNKIPELAGIEAAAKALKQKEPHLSYGHMEHDHEPNMLPQLAPLEFKPLEPAPLQIGDTSKDTRNCIIFSDEQLANLRLAAEGKLFPSTRSVYADREIDELLRSPLQLRNNAAKLNQPPATSAASLTARWTGATFSPAEEAALRVADDMLREGTSDVNKLQAHSQDGRVWRETVIYEDWKYRRTATDQRPRVLMYEKEVEDAYYPCSVVRKNHLETVPNTWVQNSISLETGVVGHLAHKIAAAPTARAQLEASICSTVQTQCGVATSHQQYASDAACRAALAALPLEDTSCRPQEAHLSGNNNTVKGNSLACKWVQSIFVSFSPTDYCPSLGSSPPASDRCATSCGAVSQQQQQQQIAAATATCDANTKTEIIASTLDALPLCLPSLVGSTQCSQNCTQALNTFLGIHVQSGAMQKCKSDPLGISETDGSGSLLLHLLQVNARTLIRRCVRNEGRAQGSSEDNAAEGDAHLLFAAEAAAPANGIIADGALDRPDASLGCMDPRLYLSEVGCRSLRWPEIAQRMMREWSGVNIDHRGDRRTTKDAIGWRESRLFDLFLQPYFNFRTTAQTKAQLLKKSERVHPTLSSPSSAELFDLGDINLGPHRYEGFEQSYETPIGRQVSGDKIAVANLFQFAWWDRIPHLTQFFSGSYTTFSKEYNATRELTLRSGAPIVSQDPPALSPRSDLYGDDLWEDLIQYMSMHMLSVPTSVPFSASDEDNILGLAKVAPAVTLPEHWHRSQGYSFGAAFAAATPPVQQLLKRTRASISYDSQAAIIEQLKADLPYALPTSHFAAPTNTDMPLVKQQASKAMMLGGMLTGVGVPAQAKPLIQFLRENWCELGAPWLEKSYGFGAAHFKGSKKAKILLEFIRLYSTLQPVANIEADPRNPGQTRVVRYDVPAHHLREDLFANADEFDFERENLGKVYNFGMFEEHTGAAPVLKQVTTGTATAEVAQEDLLLVEPRVQTESERFMRAQRKCPGRNVAWRWFLKNVDKYLPTAPVGPGPYQCKAGNPNFVHHGVDLLRQLVSVRSRDDKIWNIETFVHGKAVQNNLPVGQSWTKFNTDGEDTDSTLFIFLNGFPHAPQSWTRVLKHLHEKRPGSTSALVNLPGWGKDATRLVDTPGADCAFLGASSDILRDLILDIKKRSGGEETWARVFLVGDSTPLGSGLAWATAHKLNAYEQEDSIVGLVSFTPHPELMLKPAFGAADPRQFPFYSLLSPVLGESALGMKDFAPLQKQIQDDFTDGTFNDETAMMAEYLKFWKNTGVRSLTCYFRDNFEVKDDRMHATNNWFGDLHPKHPHILLVNAERELSYRKEQWLGSFTMIPRELARQMRLHTVSDASGQNLLFSDEHAEEVASEISDFAWGVRMTNYPWLLSAWKIVVVPPVLTGGLAYDAKKNIALGFGLIAAGLSVFGGLFLELKLGAMLIRMKNKEVFWRFGQVAMVPLCLACMASASWLGLPLWFAALFKFGFPEVTTLLLAPWLMHGKEHWVDVYARFFDGIGYLVHHTASSIIYAAILSHMVSPLLFTAAIPLSLQHAVSPMKYCGHHGESAYGFVITLLELWYQFEFFHILPHLRHWVPIMGMCMLTFAHWWWLARQLAWIPLAFFCGEKEQEEEEVVDEKGNRTSQAVKGGKTTMKPRRASVFMDEDPNEMQRPASQISYATSPKISGVSAMSEPEHEETSLKSRVMKFIPGGWKKKSNKLSDEELAEQRQSELLRNPDSVLLKMMDGEGLSDDDDDTSETKESSDKKNAALPTRGAEIV
ncbi:unnamed protein product [Amoebophrya sp. A120]|nr:unnamed protein product [Amoebophrya sp. A120]|eukprot:GSA120T00018639001.1